MGQAQIEGVGRLHVIALAQAEHLGADGAHQGRPVQHGQQHRQEKAILEADQPGQHHQ